MAEPTQAQRDPTRTLTLRKRYGSAMGGRLEKLRRAIVRYIRDQDPYLLAVPVRFEPVEDTVSRFLAWLGPQIDHLFLEVTDASGQALRAESAWQRPFIEKGYLKGDLHARTFATAQLAPTTGVPILRSRNPFRLDNLVSQAYTGIPGDPTHPGLLNIRDALREGLSDDLRASLAALEAPQDAARRMTSRVRTIARVNARRVASTQIVGAHASGSLEGYASWGLVANVRPLVEFTTAGDSRVCPTCQGLDRADRYGLGPGVYPLEQAEGVIPVHPSCRCGWIPAGVTAQPQAA